ncbi:hypothetical protein TNIN_486321 [Trichonephila inaurata madagascariensis]|uniref:Uncharacterized protein n=1 Tax=Trichonephila inaurata madagascariensis TaxID=2747483 RepID=A0A8X6I8Q1_9ARAC|nr:hypothetical protein TNIN_486321 [Trichonephila inaurata madagascariensis]
MPEKRTFLFNQFFFYIYLPWETCQPQADSILMEWLTVCQGPKSLVSIYVRIGVGRHPKTNPGKNRKITKKDRKEETLISKEIIAFFILHNSYTIKEKHKSEFLNIPCSD